MPCHELLAGGSLTVHLCQPVGLIFTPVDFHILKFPKFSGRGFWLYETDSLSQRMLVEDLPSSEPVVGSITLASNR